MSPDAEITTALPKNIKMNPIPEMIVNLKQFLTIKKNADKQEEQKCLSVKITCMYPFLVMNLTILSRQSMKQPIQQIIHLVTQLFGITFLYFLLKYSKANLIIYIIAMIKEPKAMEPI